MLSPSLISTSVAFASTCLVLGTGVALAQTEGAAPAVRVEIQSGSECATREDVVSRIQARLPSTRAVDDAGALTVRARFIPRSTGEVASEVTVTRPGTAASTRRLVARSCAEAADAVALIVVVALGQPAGSEPDKTTTAAPATVATEDPANPVTNPAATAEPRPEPKPPPAVVARKPEPAPEPPESDDDLDDSDADSPGSRGSSVPSRARAGAHLSAQSFFGPAPQMMPGITLSGLVGLDRAALWSPAILLALSHSWSGSLEQPGGTASFMFDSVSLDACPFRVELLPIEARLCASGLYGRLAAEGRDTEASPGTINRPFWVVGGSAIVTARAGPFLEPLVRISVGGNLVQDEFVFEPLEPFHEVGPTTVAVSVGFGIRSP